MPNFVCLRECVQDKMQVSQNFKDKPRICIKLSHIGYSAFLYILLTVFLAFKKCALVCDTA